jgi:hypothetical protein
MKVVDEGSLRSVHDLVQNHQGLYVIWDTEIPTIIDPAATKKNTLALRG